MKVILLTVSLQDERYHKVLERRYVFDTHEKCETFIFQFFGIRLLKWAETHSDQWDVIQEELGFKKRTEEKRLQILARDPKALQALWKYYDNQCMSEGKDVWCWTVEELSLNPERAPLEVGSYNLNKDFFL